MADDATSHIMDRKDICTVEFVNRHGLQEYISLVSVVRESADELL